MNVNYHIKKIIAVFLLSVFTLAITPKKILHSLLANHTDNTAESSNTKTHQLSKSGFNCQCDDLVVKSNFITASLFTGCPVSVHSSLVDFNKPSFHSLSRFLLFLRGPPVNFQS